MKWDLYSQNLMSEYHIRYGGYGGIGYYLVSDSYIALVSRFTTCGSWEGHYILDFLKENESDVRPDTIHADTQGQSTAIFSLAYLLLGVELMPRIRNWKDQNILRPSGRQPTANTNTSTLCSPGTWTGTSLRACCRICCVPWFRFAWERFCRPTSLRRLASHSRKNRLYSLVANWGAS
jgi:hypothetical protein